MQKILSTRTQKQPLFPQLTHAKVPMSN